MIVFIIYVYIIFIIVVTLKFGYIMIFKISYLKNDAIGLHNRLSNIVC